MAIKHGVYNTELPTQIGKPRQTTSGIQFIVGTAPIHRLANPAKAVNQMFLISSLAQAKAALGYSEEFDAFDLCQSMYMDFSVLKVAPAIFVNVLDPAVHKTAVAATTCTVTNGQALLDKKYMLIDANLVVKNGDDVLVKGEDYVAKHNEDDKLVITLLLETMPASITVQGNQLNPSAVTATDIIGGEDAETGVVTGLSLINDVYTKFGINAATIVCPNWSKNATVAAAMVAVCEDISGVFKAETIIDVDSSTYTKYTDAEAMKASMGIKSPHAFMVWPKVKIGSHILSGSVNVAAVTQYTDDQNGGVPNISPSNKAAYIDAVVLADGTEVLLNPEQGNVLNTVGIATFVKAEGLKVWGNYSAAYPDNDDPKDKFWCIRRFFSWHGNNFIRNYFAQVDNPMNKKLIDAVIDSENRVLNGYVANGQCAAASIELSDENTSETLAAGKLYFNTVITPFPPAQEIHNTLSFDPDALAEALTM